MPKKRSSGPKGQTTVVLDKFQDNLRRLQHDAESVLAQTRRQAEQLISRDQQRAVDRIFSQAQKVRSDLEKRARRASQDVESTAERLLGTLEKEAVRRLLPLLRRLDLPSRREIIGLTQRITQMERQLKAATSRRRPRTATSKQVADRSDSDD